MGAARFKNRFIATSYAEIHFILKKFFRISEGVCVKFAIMIFASLLFCLPPVNAQVAGGSITGTVTGDSGGAMPNVRISVKDVSTSVERTATTNPSGLFNIPDLSPGNYEMNVSASGFVTQIWTAITV